MNSNHFPKKYFQRTGIITCPTCTAGVEAPDTDREGALDEATDAETDDDTDDDTDEAPEEPAGGR